MSEFWNFMSVFFRWTAATFMVAIVMGFFYLLLLDNNEIAALCKVSLI